MKESVARAAKKQSEKDGQRQQSLAVSALATAR